MAGVRLTPGAPHVLVGSFDVACGVGHVRLQRAKWPLKMVFDRQIRRMNRRNFYVPCRIMGRLLAKRALCYCCRSEKRSSGECRFKILAEILVPMTGAVFRIRTRRYAGEVKNCRTLIR